MTRRVHAEGLRERQNMKEAARTRKDGSWCVVGTDSSDGFDSGLQSWGLSKDEAEDEKEKLDKNPEFEHLTHIVMTYEEYREWCDENNVEVFSGLQ